MSARRSALLASIVSTLSLVLACLAPADEPKAPEKPFGLGKRVPWTTSRLVGSPDPPPPYDLARVFPKRAFKNPVCLAQEPGTDRMLVAENGGKIWAFSMSDPDGGEPELYFDYKRSLYAFSFHPKYEENGQVFLFSPVPPEGTPDPKLSRVARVETDRSERRKIRPGTERVIIEWPSGGHNGGEAIIGPDGYLYICNGDGTSGSDVDDTGQGVNDLLSVMMRLDVEHPDPGRNYGIPKDNPFVGVPGARPEIWSFGFRNPWRMSFDPKTGWLWVGDVGQDLWEMIRIDRKGANHGWSAQEGTHPFHPHKKTGPGSILPPIVEHHHVECRSITGGYAYHGSKFPELEGAYVYGDYQYGKIWGLRYDGKAVTWHKELADTTVLISSFTLSRDGELYAVDNSTGFIHALRRTPPGSSTSAFPRRLSETGVFRSVKDQQPSPGVIPYDVNAPQWADGARIDRWFGIPNGGQVPSPESWGFPDGLVAAQTLSLPLEGSRDGAWVPIETRILVKQKDEHVVPYSYRWNDERTDAVLVEAAGAEFPLSARDPSAPNGVRRQAWRVPGRNECMFCHSRAAGFVLGLNPSQMNRDFDYAGTVDNQIRALDHAGLFKSRLSKPVDSLPRHVNPHDPKADLAERVRTYLHVNCSICHVSDGGGNSFIELAKSMKLEDTKTVDGRPVQGTFGIPEARVIAPGDPERSVLYYRVSSIGSSRMPRVGSREVDTAFVDMVYRWIERIPPKDTTATENTHARLSPMLARLRADSRSDKQARAEAIRTLTSTTSGTLALARAVGQGEVSAEARAEILAAAREHPANEVRDLLERFLPESERIARLGERVDPEQVLRLDGDAARGRGVFTAESVVNCKSCHRLDGVGVEVGPDLSKIGAKYPRADLLREILEPSRTIDPKFTVHAAATRQGLVTTGLLVERNERQVTLRDAQGQKVTIAVGDLESLEPQKLSLMPEFLLRGLTPQQAADLLAYLSSLK